MDYLAPHWLWLLLVVAALAVLYGLLQWRRRSTFTVRFTNVELLDSVAPKRPGWRRHLVAGLFLASLALLVVSIARPTRDEAAPLGPVLVLAIDTSLSMDATDVEPNRIEAAQEAATDLVDGLSDNVRVGLISFNGSATIQVTPTTDHDEVRDAVGRLELAEFTAIGEAIFAGLDAIQIAQSDQADAAAEAGEDLPPSQLVVMSDGETTSGRPDVEAAHGLAQHPDRAGRGVQVERGDPQQGGLARPVGPEHHPPLSVLDRPGQVRQHGPAVDADRHLIELEGGGHLRARPCGVPRWRTWRHRPRPGPPARRGGPARRCARPPPPRSGPPAGRWPGGGR